MSSPKNLRNTKPISLHPLTLEQALGKAMKAKPPVKAESVASKPKKKK